MTQSVEKKQSELDYLLMIFSDQLERTEKLGSRIAASSNRLEIELPKEPPTLAPQVAERVYSEGTLTAIHQFVKRLQNYNDGLEYYAAKLERFI